MKNHPQVIEVELPKIPLDQSRRHACLELALKWTESDVEERDHDDIVKAAEAFERFIVGPLFVLPESYVCNRWPPGVAPGAVPPVDEQPQEPAKAGVAKKIRAWISRDNDRLQMASIFATRSPVKEVRSDGSETFVSDSGDDTIAADVDLDLLGIVLFPGEVREVEITIRRLA